jgi:hypothetical protein
MYTGQAEIPPWVLHFSGKRLPDCTLEELHQARTDAEKYRADVDVFTYLTREIDAEFARRESHA